MKFKSFKEYVDRKGKLVKPREELKADYHDSIPKAPKGHKAPYVGKGIKVKGDQGLGDVGDKNMVWEPDTEVPSSKKKIVDVLDEQAKSLGSTDNYFAQLSQGGKNPAPDGSGRTLIRTQRQQNEKGLHDSNQLDKQIYAKHPKGSEVDKATADQIIQMYKDAGLDDMDAPLVNSKHAKGMFAIEQKSVGHGHSADPKFGDMVNAKIMSIMHSPEYKHKSSKEILHQVASDLEVEREDIEELLDEHFPKIVEMLKKHDIDQGSGSPRWHRHDDDYDHDHDHEDEQKAGSWDAGVDESAFGKYVESKDAFKMMQDHPGKSCKKAHPGKTHEEWKKSKKSDKEESKDDKEESKDKGKSKFDMMKDHPFKSCNSVHKNKTHEEWKKSKKSDD